MFDKRELKAMAWGYGITVPIAAAAIYLSSSVLIAAPIFMLGFLITLVRMNMD